MAIFRAYRAIAFGVETLPAGLALPRHRHTAVLRSERALTGVNFVQARPSAVGHAWAR
jgi:hypothetical protein